MHVIFRESKGLGEADTPIDLGQTPGDLVVLSFSDSDLGAFAEAWHLSGGPGGRLPSLRLANLAALKHPLSVDTYVEQTLEGAKGILIRLIGGVPFWDYGLQQIKALAHRTGAAIAVLPADRRPDPNLEPYCTLPASTLERLKHLCDLGGVTAAQAALQQLSLAAGFYAGPVAGAKTLPLVGAWTPAHGVSRPATSLPDGRPRILLTFYRSYLVAADLAPLRALWAAFEARGYQVRALFAPSLKAPEAALWLERRVRAFAPHAIVNATAFSGKGECGTSPLDTAEVPVFQVALATSNRTAWAESERGLSPADLAMHVVLPEVDGRILAGVTSFKEPAARDPHLEFSRTIHQPEPERIEAIAARVNGWLTLAQTPVGKRKTALILSTYPGKDWNAGHAVGLDAPASASAILEDLARQGYCTGTPPDDISATLQTRRIAWPLVDYRAALATLPQSLRDDLTATWGTPEDDPAVKGAAFHFTALQTGNMLIALQPERGTPKLRDAEYHDLGRTPRHAYVAFYLWLQRQTQALIHIGAHGTLEWLPGKSVALSGTCWPELLIGTLPVIYPFIVNDPGEAAQAKRRIGAVTLGHIPPPLRESGTPERLAPLEALLDEFSNAVGLDPRRRDRLQADIRAEAQALGVEDDLGLGRAECSAEAITRIDRFVCDVKESQFSEGLHIWGRPARPGAPFETNRSTTAERQSLLDALDGKRIPGGPSGSPYRGRVDVLPTGRNIFTTDPRSTPSRAAYAQGQRLADELIRRHLQDHGDWPKGLVVDLWGSATMRTAGEEFAMALALIGVRPTWDDGSARVGGIEVIPLAEMNYPRIDVTLRVSGLFRDVFPTLSALFGFAVHTLSERDEAADHNPYVSRSDLARVYGPRPGRFGLGMGDLVESYGPAGRHAAGEAWLAASAWALDQGEARHDASGIAARVASADSFVHLQDLPETDLLLSVDYATHEAGFAAAKALAGGGEAALYHFDNTNPDMPRARALPEEIARVVQARAANSAWISGMRVHGFRGAAEIAATLENMAAFAHLAGVVSPHLFDLFYEATLGEPEVDAFLAEANPDSHAAMGARFAELLDAGLWQTRRNSIRASLEAAQ